MPLTLDRIKTAIQKEVHEIDTQAMITAMLRYVDHQQSDEQIEMVQAVENNLETVIHRISMFHPHNAVIKMLGFVHRLRATKNLPILLIELGKMFYEHRTEIGGVLPEQAVDEWQALIHSHVFHPGGDDDTAGLPESVIPTPIMPSPAA